MSFVYLARQPIYTATLAVHGYELLYRAGDVATAEVADGDVATAIVLVNALSEIGLANLVGDRPAFVNMTRGFLAGDLHLPLDHTRVVLEILEDVAVDPALVAAVRALSGQGFTVALDDFVYDATYDELLEIADIVKFDVRALGLDELGAQVARVQRFGVELLAEKVETADEFEACRRLGFRYFQGYYFSRPSLVRSREIAPNKISLVQLLAELQRADIDVAELAKIISRDVALSYKILRFVNSAYLNLAQPIESVHHGIVLLGLATVRRWATLLVLARPDGKPSELMVQALVRARLCEQLATRTAAAAPDAAFTVGLFSVLDALLDLPMDEVLPDLGLGGDIEAALLHRRGALGRVLGMVCSYEEGEWQDLPVDLIDLVDPIELRDAYVDSLRWSADTMGAMEG